MFDVGGDFCGGVFVGAAFGGGGGYGGGEGGAQYKRWREEEGETHYGGGSREMHDVEAVAPDFVVGWSEYEVMKQSCRKLMVGRRSGTRKGKRCRGPCMC